MSFFQKMTSMLLISFSIQKLLERLRQ